MGTQAITEPQNEQGIIQDTTEALAPKPAPGVLGAIVDETIRRRVEELQLEEGRFHFQQRRAKLFAKSGLFGKEGEVDMDKAIAQAMVRIELGESMGFSPAESLQGIHIISSSAAVSANLRAARMQAAGYSWDIDWLDGNATWKSSLPEVVEGCRLWLKFKGRAMLDRQGDQISVSYTKTDASKMMTKIWEYSEKEKKRVGRTASILEKDNWQMTPANMYFSRVVTNAQRWYAPGVLSINILSVEEAQDLPVGGDANEDPTGSVEAARDVAVRKLRAAGAVVTEEGHVIRQAKSAPPAEPIPENAVPKPFTVQQPKEDIPAEEAPTPQPEAAGVKPKFGFKPKE